MLELLLALAEEIAGISEQLEAAGEYNNIQKAYKKFKSVKRKYHNFRSKQAQFTNPTKYYLNKGKSKLLSKYAEKYVSFQQKLNKINPNLAKMASRRLDRMVNERIFKHRKAELADLRRIKRNLVNKYNRLEKKIERANKKNSTITENVVDDNTQKEQTQIQNEISKTEKKIKIIKKRSRDRNIRNLRIEGNKRKLSSSFLQTGIFILKEVYPAEQYWKKHERYGQLILMMGNKTYIYDNFPQVWWISMIEATGSNGTGAGSILWNTLWYKKRTISIQLPEGYTPSKRKDYMNNSRHKALIRNFNVIQGKRASISKRSKYYLERIAKSDKKVIIKVRKIYKKRK